MSRLTPALKLDAPVPGDGDGPPPGTVAAVEFAKMAVALFARIKAESPFLYAQILRHVEKMEEEN